MNDKKICVLGGDERMLSALRALCQNGYAVSYYGIEGDTLNAIYRDSLEDAVQNSEILLLPLPFSTDGIRLFSPLSDKNIKLSELSDCVTKKHLLIGGKLSHVFLGDICKKGCKYYDYYNSERLTVLNAIPTAEGALAIAVNETKCTVFGSKCAVLGYGRIGKILAKMLKALNAEVTVYARSEQALTWAETDGMQACPIDKICNTIGDKDMIFNTVPAVILTKDVLNKTKKDVLITDLASAPGGVDAKSARELCRKVIFALSLPGKVAPETSGKMIADCVTSKIEGGIL